MAEVLVVVRMGVVCCCFVCVCVCCAFVGVGFVTLVAGGDSAVTFFM